MRPVHGWSRRNLLGLAFAATLVESRDTQGAAALGDDGNYVQDWYLDSFLDLAEDAESAEGKNKTFVIQWGMRGCPACKRLHTVYFAEPTIANFVRERFDIMHLDTFGSREVIDLDGERISEKALAGKRAVRTTPTFQYFARRETQVVEVARMPGLLGEREFLAMFRFVAERGFADGSFEAWLRVKHGG